MAERRLEREYIHSSFYRRRGVGMSQSVWVDVETCNSSPLPANISNCLSGEMPIPPGTREDEIFRIAATFALALAIGSLPFTIPMGVKAYSDTITVKFGYGEALTVYGCGN